VWWFRADGVIAQLAIHGGEARRGWHFKILPVGFRTGVAVKRHQDPDALPPPRRHHGTDGILQPALSVLHSEDGVLACLVRRGAKLVREGWHCSKEEGIGDQCIGKRTELSMEPSFRKEAKKTLSGR
jgi:hypothetical protein